MSELDVLIPTYRRPGALAVTLGALAGQRGVDFRVVVSDQSPEGDGADHPVVGAVVRVLELAGHQVVRRRHLPRRGMAEHRQALLDGAAAPYALFLDDDVVVEPDLLARLLRVIRTAGCGFVGSGLVGPSFAGDVRPDEEAVEFWDGPVTPERIRPGGPGWDRHRLHSAANLHHLRQRLRPAGDRLYRVAWVGGCVLYDVAKLRAVGGFGFWPSLPPEHSGEDVLAQLLVMERFGGCGLFPSGAYHLELPTTIADRRVDAPQLLAV